MRLSSHVSSADWIRSRLTGNDPRVSLRVGDVVPDGYERYIRLFHPVCTGDELLTWQQIADSTGARFHPWRTSGTCSAIGPRSSVPRCSPARCSTGNSAAS
jgi:hypothetical protein